ncbi:FecR family protein [Parasphingorhabdus cellanae]|uniref:FecR domain-containing protein n=1 Tax=Parasphingorhabdus cellanae TaxID=2806553 RepID=A0ABX7T8N7_9SPHN|nr:FecR domain-containing protein [Parasphingorhabdus cellanae]QTD57476.1 FecR domain-containing protein [Parasphingorhabdus cellanae]
MNNKLILKGGEPQLLDEAIEWHVRVNDPHASSSDWTAFGQWLDQGEAHRLAYDEVCENDLGLDGLQENPADDEPDEIPSVPVPANDNRKWQLGFGLVASLFMAFLFWPSSGNPELDIFQTAPGEKRVIVLGPETRIEMNGDTVVATNPANPRFARLDRGEAVFFVKHDESKPFVVESGSFTLRDEGTIFNVRNVEKLFSVSVSEGSVRFNPEEEQQLVKAGQSLTLTEGKNPVLRTIDLESVAGWREGRLHYDNAPLSAIAADLGRLSGKTISVADSIAGQRFTGVILVDEESEAMAQKLEQLLGIQTKDTGEGWHFAP